MHSTLYVSHPPNTLLVVVAVHLGQPVGAMDPLLVLVSHGWAGHVHDVVVVGH